MHDLPLITDLRNDLFNELSEEVCIDSFSFVESDLLGRVLKPFSGLRTGGGGIARCIK